MTRSTAMRGASVELPCRRTATTQRDPSGKLESAAPTPLELPAGTLAAATDPAFAVPSAEECANRRGFSPYWPRVFHSR